MKSIRKVRGSAGKFACDYRIIFAVALIAFLYGGITQSTEADNATSRTKRMLAKVKPAYRYTPPAPHTVRQPDYVPSQQDAANGNMLYNAIRIGVIGLALAGFVVFLSFRLFSPSGWFNRKAKEEYIPSQFRAEHRRHLNELAQAAHQGGLPLGVRMEGFMSKFVAQKLALPKSAREDNPHMVLLGAGGKGKSRMMCNLIWHDIEANDRAVVVIDSEGGLIDGILEKADGAFDDRLVVIDPSRRKEYPYSYNPLALDSHQDPQLVANNIVLGFKAIYQEVPGRQQAQDQWSAQTANILRNAVMLLMANGRSLADIPMLLSENDFRDLMLQNIEKHVEPGSAYSTVLDAWSQYRRLARTEQWISWVEPILNRIQPVLADARVKAALTGAGEQINLKQIIAERHILLVRLPQGQLDPSANLLGSLIVTGMRQAAISLNVNESNHANPCALYVDELDKFVDSETFGFIAAESRRYQIGLTGILRSLQGINEVYRNNILANVGTICTFALTRKDAEMLGTQMFRVDGRKFKHRPIGAFFNPISVSPQFEQVVDEEKLNIDRLVGLDKQSFFCYRVGTVAGVTKLRAHDFVFTSKSSPSGMINREVDHAENSNRLAAQRPSPSR